MSEPLFLLDSNICIYLLEALSVPARTRVESYYPGEVVTSAVAYAEVMRGVNPDDRKAVADSEALFAVIPVLPFETAAAAAYRRLPFKRGSFDRLIAAHALALDLTFVTNNEDDFKEVAGLRVENWTRA
ncbi:MAG TPA: type II toxin-antitoxin system VapC family toxin [Allosphingosinicella sp.]|nr:type II toxin-antitoxin system VapC family toxin [Allosphingosinicella sp.]